MLLEIAYLAIGDPELSGVSFEAALAEIRGQRLEYPLFILLQHCLERSEHGDPETVWERASREEVFLLPVMYIAVNAHEAIVAQCGFPVNDTNQESVSKNNPT